MSVDLKDPGISQASAEMDAGMLRWVLLGYTNKLNQLKVFASGNGDVDEMKEYVKAEDICYGIFSEPSVEKSFRLTVTYIPDTVGGVWRARALVHGKAVARKFGSDKAIRVSDVNHFNVPKFRIGLELPPRVTDYLPSSPAIVNSFYSPSLLPVTTPPPRGDSLKQRPAVTRKPISSNRHYQEDLLDSAGSLTDLPSPLDNATQLSLFSMKTGTAAIENFRLQSESPPLPSAVKLSNGSLSLPSPPEDSDGDDDDGSDHHLAASLLTESSRSSRHLYEAQSPRQPFSPGPFQPSDSSEGEESQVGDEEENCDRKNPLRPSIDHSEVLDDLEDIPDSCSVTSSTLPKSKLSTTAPVLSLLSRNKPLPPVRLSSVDLLEGLHIIPPSSRTIEGLPVSSEPLQRTPTRKSGDSIGAATRSSLPSPPSSPEGIKPQFFSPPVPPLPPVNLQTISLSHIRRPQSPSSQPSTIMQNGGQPSSLPQFQFARKVQPSVLPSSPSNLPLYGTYTSNRSAMTHLNPHRRLSITIDEAEEQKLAVLVEERRRRTMELAERERIERREQEARDREFMARREQERLKRFRNAKSAEMVRAEMRRQQECEEARRKAQQERRCEERLTRQSKVRERIQSLEGMLLLSGFVSVLSGTTWRRRYYQLTTEEWKFFKNDEDMGIPLNIITLSRIKAVREWDEGYEELEFMPNGFAVELNDGAPWLFFADSKEEKEIFSGLLGQPGCK